MTRHAHARQRAPGAPGGAWAGRLTISIGIALFSIPSSSAAALVAPAELRCACGGGRRFRGRPTVATALEPEEALERELDLDVEAARGAMFAPPRAAEGDAAFADTTWQVRLKLHEGGSCLFSAQLLEDFRARFSDKEEFGAGPRPPPAAPPSRDPPARRAQASGRACKTSCASRSRRGSSRTRCT